MDWHFGHKDEQRRPGGEPISVEYTESDGLLWLSIKNFLLTVVTLTIYRFWAKTNVRRQVWSNVKINGQPLEYTGTGMELFLGALLVFCILILPYIGLVTFLQIAYGPEHPLTIGLQVVFFVLVLMLYGMALYRARRYRLSRTLWRGIRGTLTGSSLTYSLMFFGAMLLKGMTLGWSTPAMNLNLQQRMIGDMSFGNKSFLFAGTAGPLYKRYALCWFLAPIAVVAVSIAFGASFAASGTGELFSSLEGKSEDEVTRSLLQSTGWLIGIFASIAAVFIIYSVIWTLYTAREMNVFASYTTFDNARFNFDATVPSLVGLWLGNLAILIFTLGIGQPYIVQRVVRYMCDRLTVDGTVDAATIQQSSAALDKRGEGLVEAFDLDAF